MYRASILAGCFVVLSGTGGCATQKESFTARTGIEQLLISSAVDKSLDHLDFSPLHDKQVFFDTKYLNCVDKEYIQLAIRYHIMMVGGVLLDKADKADTIVEVASGGVGTDGQFLFIGIPEIPLPGMIAPVAIPKLSIVDRTKMNGTAKILVVAYDAKTKLPLSPSGLTLARSDQKNWNVLGMGNVQTGSVQREIAAATKEGDFDITTGINFANGSYNSPLPPHYVTSSPPSSGVIVSPAPSNQPMVVPGRVNLPDSSSPPPGYGVVQPTYAPPSYNGIIQSNYNR